MANEEGNGESSKRTCTFESFQCQVCQTWRCDAFVGLIGARRELSCWQSKVDFLVYSVYACLISLVLKMTILTNDRLNLRKLNQPNSDGLQPCRDGLQPTSDGLQPTLPVLLSPIFHLVCVRLLESKGVFDFDCFAGDHGCSWLSNEEGLHSIAHVILGCCDHLRAVMT